MIQTSSAKRFSPLALAPIAIQAAGFLLLAFFVGAAARLPFAQLLAGPDAGASAPVRALMMLVTLAIFASAIYLARRPTPLPVRPFMAAALAAAVVVKVVLIIAVEPRWGGDFLRYWENAAAMVEGGSVHAATSIYKQRASLVFYPVYKIFGDVPLALKIVNALGWIALAALAYDLLRIARNHQTAQAFTALLLLCPMPAFDALFPSHDHWGTVFLVAALWSVTRAGYAPAGEKRSWWVIVGYSVLCALCVTLMEIQRGAASMLVLAMMATALLLLANRSNPQAGGTGFALSKSGVVTASVAVLLLFVPLNFVAEQAGFRKSSTADHARAATIMKMAAHGGVFSNARSATWVRFDERFTEKRAQGSAAVTDFAQSIVLTSWADPEGTKLELIRDVSPRLFQLGYPSDWDVNLRAPAGMSAGTRAGLVAYTNAFGLVFAIATTLSLLVAALAARTPPLPVLLALVFTLLLAASLLGFFENKPPNLYSGWITYLMLISWIASSTPSRVQAVNKQGLVASVVGVLLVCGGYLGARATLDALYHHADGRIIMDWEVAHRPASGGAPQEYSPHPWPLGFNTEYYAKGSIKDWIIKDAGDDSRRLGQYASRFYTILEHPLPIRKGDRVAMSRRICAGSSRKTLEFFLFAGYQRKERPRSFTVEVSGDGQAYRTIHVPLEGRNFRLFTVDGMFDQSECRDVELAVRANVSSAGDSWRRASHVEIWNPRLIESAAND